MKKKTNVTKEPLVNLKEKNALHTFRVTIRDREHFYKIIHWLNANVGKGTNNWTMEGHALKQLKQGKMPTPAFYVYKEDFDESASLYLSLL